MSTITRRVFAVTVLLAMSVFLTGCGASAFEGTWTLDKEAMRPVMKSAMETKMAEEAGEGGGAAMEMMKGMIDGLLDTMMEGMDATLTVNADGTFTGTGKFGDKDALSGTWSEKGGVAMFDAAGEDDDMTGTITETALSLKPANPPADMPAGFALLFKKSE